MGCEKMYAMLVRQRKFYSKTVGACAKKYLLSSVLKVAVVAMILSMSAYAAEGTDKPVLKGFIVSDAHFGWAHKMQPSPQEQQKAMDNIISRFPDLDVFMDTGDAHHNDHHNNSNPYKARKDWIDIIQGGCGQTPFYFVLGNHELRSNEDADPEMRSNVMGSTTCRPYYSFDMQGIHFISFPELIRATYITEEEWDWLELDLSLNRDKTIIMLSHNNIIGTTTGNEPGYRGIMDSDRMLQVFKENPNVISWMHGHNHNYEIVNQNDMLFVSNGRIGGFDPSRGKQGIGGIYFEISAEGLLVKCYSASKNVFLDTIDPALTQELNVKTSYDANDSFAYSYGVGGAVNGERIPAYHHHAGDKVTSELFLTGCSNPIINDDHAMTKYAERNASHGLDKLLLAAKVNHGNAGFDFLNPGIRLKANDNWWTTVTMPSDNYDRYSYYRCPVGKKYKVSIDLDAKEKATQALWLRLHVYDIDGRKLRIVQSDKIKVRQGRQTLECTLEVPEITNFETIYSNPDSDNLVNIAIEASFAAMKSDVDIFSIKLEQENESQHTVGAGAIIDGKKYYADGLIEKSKNIRIPIEPFAKPRSVNEIIAGGNKRVTYLVRHSGLKWQVRNATVTYNNDSYYIDKMRNRLSDKLEIIIAPLAKTADPYLHRIRRAEQVRFKPFDSSTRSLSIKVGTLGENAELEVFSPTEPKHIDGAKSWSYENNIISIRLDKPGDVQIKY
jgi:hypothetical protein